MEREKILTELLELEELIEIEEDKEELKKLKNEYRMLNKKLNELK